MSKKYKKICATLNCSEHFLILASTTARQVSISGFAFLVGIPEGIIVLIIYTITAGIKNYNSIINKKKKHYKIVLLEKSKLNSIES